jgi:predicted amidohydrolase YtcJ
MRKIMKFLRKTTGMRMFAAGLLLPALLAGMGCSEQPQEQAPVQSAPDYADLVLVHGGIYTVDDQRSWAQAAAVRDGIIIEVGSDAEVEPLIGPETRVVDLSGRMALPGFHDAHLHAIDGGVALTGCDLTYLDSIEAIIEKVTGCADVADTGWLEGHAFDVSLFGQNGPHKSLLDAISTLRPIVLWASDYHNVWLNSKALELAGITAETPDPPLGVIERDADGSPSGTLREAAQDMLRAAMPQPTLQENIAHLRVAIEYLNSLGVTSFIEGWVGRVDYQSYEALARAGDLSARVVTSLPYETVFADHLGDEFWQVLDERERYASERLNHDSVKLFLDGVLEGETAALIEPYLGMNGARGDLMFEPGALNDIVTRFDGMGLQVQIHAIGDRAVRAGLDAVAAARQHNGVSDNRHHIVHLQLVDPADIGRFAALGVTANFQPLWAFPDEYITELNLPVVGEARVQSMYPIASVVRAGGRIVAGSDWNVSSPNPLWAIEVGVRRQDPSQAAGPVLNGNERVSLATMIEAYTINGAWLMHQEDRVGSIEVGKRADIVVLDRNLFDIPATEISDAGVVETLLDGVTVWAIAEGEQSSE